MSVAALLRRLTLVLGILLLPHFALAQDGTVSGTVTDVGADPLPGVTVMLLGTGFVAVTDTDGAYSLEGVPAGDYSLTASLEGFKGQAREISVAPGGALSEDYTLELDLLNMDQIVVTGAISPYDKLESSVAVTTQTSEQIAQKAPLSTAQMLEVVPGFWTESSGGEGGNNLFARGIPADGSFRYVAMLEDGLPVYDSPELAFTNVDLLYRIDEGVAGMEAVRGGTGAVYASNAPGGVVNFVNKTGGDIPEGVIKFTVGDYDLFRTDLSYGGPLTEEWRFHIGGFYREDSGVRDPGFPANRGGQLKASLTRLFDNGYLRFNGKRLDERNIFYLPIPLQNPKSPSGIPGFDPNTGTLTSIDHALVKIPTPDGQSIERNLKDGMNPEITQFGGELFLNLENGWTFKDTFRFMKADVMFNAIFSLFNPADAILAAEDALAQVQAEAPQVVDYRYRYTHFPDLVFDPATANGNGLIVVNGWWTVDKPLDMFVNDLRFTKQFEDHAFSAGFYFSRYGADEFWVFNEVLSEVRDAPRVLDIDFLDAGGNRVTGTDNGFNRYGNFHRSDSAEATVTAIYLTDEWQVNDKLRIDAGLRWEEAEFSGNVEELETFDLGDPTTFADDEVLWGNGNFLSFNHTLDDVGISVGLNYSIDSDLAIYGRWSEGFRMPDFEQWVDGNVTEPGEVESITQVEGGVKYSSPKLGLFAAVFYSTFDNVPFSDEVLDPQGNLVTARRFASTETIGVEAEIVAQLAEGFNLAVTTTYQQPEFKDFQFTFGGEQFNFSGNQVRRIPELIFSATPSYRRGPFRAFLTYFHADDRFVDDANTIVLPKYDVIDVGVSYELTRNLLLELHGNNLTDEIGLTEGNPRTGQIVGVQQDIFMARPILGQSWRLSASYKF